MVSFFKDKSLDLELVTDDLSTKSLCQNNCDPDDCFPADYGGYCKPDFCDPQCLNNIEVKNTL